MAPPEDADGWSAAETIEWGITTFERQAVVLASFQLESIVVLHLAHSRGLDARVVTIDTGRLPAETHDFMESVQLRLGLSIEILAPKAEDVSAMTTSYGTNLFRRDPALRQACCEVRKVRPLDRLFAEAGVQAWITGLRRDSSIARSATPRIQTERHGSDDLVKISPLVDWSRDDVWAYVRDHDLPVHPLHERGYPSIGCAPCTRAVGDGEPERAGRWWWEVSEERECGLHGMDRSSRFELAMETIVGPDQRGSADPGPAID